MIYPVAGRMADSTRPYLIPDKYALRPNGVLMYADGAYTWPESQVRRFPRRWSITTTGNLAIARHARAIDVERFDATPRDVAPYADRRADLGEVTIVYCSRSTVPEVVAADNEWQDLFWHIATLDGRNWDPETMATDLASVEDVHISPAKIRAIQNIEGENYDSSLIFGDPEWSTEPKE